MNVLKKQGFVPKTSSKARCFFKNFPMGKNKKAGFPAYLVMLILVLVLLVVFSGIYYYFKVNVAEGSLREIRRQNVKNHANAHLAGLDLSSELNFPIIRKKIKKGDEIEDSSKALVHDWSDLLKGEKELFPTKTEEIVYCVPGHYLEFKDKKKISAIELANYQKTHTVNSIGATGIIGDNNVPISEYITGYTTNKDVFEEEMNRLKEALADAQEVTIVNDEEFFNEKKGL